MYQALYRKWRPSTFDQVIGQEHITQTLKNQVTASKLSHAYLFIGSRGTGKTTCARILSRAVNCVHPVDGNPCGECESCRAIMEGSCTDVIEIDAASNNGVDDVRHLREEAVFTPVQVKCRVYIIDEVHMLSTQAFNALLKILEEPPEHLIFILATTELHKVPATILSRCQRHTFKRIETGLLSDYLLSVSNAENIDLSKDAAEMISVLSDGGVRDALSILDQCSGEGKVNSESLLQIMGLAGSDTMFSVLEGIISHDTPKVLELFKNIWMEGKDPASFLDSLRVLLRDVLIVSTVKSASLGLVSGRYSSVGLKEFAGKLSYQQLVSAINTVQSAFLGMKYTSNTRLSAEICLISLCDDLVTDDLASIKSHISKLEGRLNGILTGTVEIKTAASLQSSEFRKPEIEPVKLHIVKDGAVPVSQSVAEPEIEPDIRFTDTPAAVATAADEAPVNSAIETADTTQVMDPASFNKRLLEAVKPRLPVDIRYSIGNPTDFIYTFSDGLLKIEAEPMLLYGRINKVSVTQIFAEEAEKICDGPVSVIVSKMTSRVSENNTGRKLDELKKFPEVKIIE